MVELAARLHDLKERSGASYAELARRCGISASTLHRYCRGQVLPDSYGMVERIALVCGADRAELAELYTLWARADAERSRAGDDAPVPAVAGPPAGEVAEAAVVSGRTARPHGRRLLWLTALLGVLVLAAAVGAVSLPGGHVAKSTGSQRVFGPAWSQYPATVPSTFYGVTINSDSGAMPGFRVGAVRLWDSETRWSGDATTLARMTQRASTVIRRADPDATVVCPSMGDLWEPASQRFLLEFAAADGYQACDAAGVKLYPRRDGDTPESLIRLGAVIDRTFHEAGVHPPLWNTGTVYRIPADRPLDQRRSIAYATRFYLIGMYLRYQRMYFYNWGGTAIPLVLQAAGGRPTAAAQAVDTLQRWLVGARIVACGQGRQAGLPTRVWQCRFLPPAGRTPDPMFVRWTESGTATMPADAGTRVVRLLDGTSLPAPRTLRVTEQPVLVMTGR
ncbi:helix-turn-helix transcriptional regulator [Actinoallomurus liliacearum]